VLSAKVLYGLINVEMIVVPAIDIMSTSFSVCAFIFVTVVRGSVVSTEIYGIAAVDPNVIYTHRGTISTARVLHRANYVQQFYKSYSVDNVVTLRSQHRICHLFGHMFATVGVLLWW
jgi:hypothetical protein